MLTQTHNLIGRVIGKVIEKELKVKLKNKSLRLGCVMPDFIPSLIAIPHYKDSSFEYILKRIKMLENTPIPDKGENLRTFSQELGIILHFITDFFCFAHNNSDYDKMPLHIIYEFKLAGKFEKALNKKHYNKYMKEITAISPVNNIEMYLIEKHEAYMDSCDGNIDTDLKFSIEACAAVSLHIIESSMKKAAEVQLSNIA